MGQSDKEIADEYFVRNSEVRQAQVGKFKMHQSYIIAIITLNFVW